MKILNIIRDIFKKPTYTTDMRYKKYVKTRNIQKTASNILFEELEPYIKRLGTQTRHIKTGDTAVINKYSKKWSNCKNYWDSGPDILEPHVNYFGNIKNIPKPTIVDILTIEVDASYAGYLIEQFVEKHFDKLQNYIIKDILFKKYVEFVNSGGYLYANNLGLYHSAKFKIHNSEYQYNYGINIYTFLEINTEDAKETLRLWNNEININKIAELSKTHHINVTVS